MTDVRVIEVDKLFLVQLKTYLQPEERWVKDHAGKTALILFTMSSEFGTRELLFVRKDDA